MTSWQAWDDPNNPAVLWGFGHVGEDWMSHWAMIDEAWPIPLPLEATGWWLRSPAFSAAHAYPALYPYFPYPSVVVEPHDVWATLGPSWGYW